MTLPTPSKQSKLSRLRCFFRKRMSNDSPQSLLNARGIRRALGVVLVAIASWYGL